MYNYNEELAKAKIRNKVYKGIRYYTFGETYFCVENDIDMLYPFDRICVSVTDTQIKKHIKGILKSMVPIAEVKRIIENDIDKLQMEINESKQTISDLERIKVSLLNENT